MEPWQSWAVAICIGGAAFMYYTKDSKYFMKAKETAANTISEQLPNSTSKRRADKQNHRRKDNAAKPDQKPPTYAEAASSGALSSNASSKKRKANRATPAPAPATSQSAPPARAQEAREAEISTEDKDWAQQLAARKIGVSIDANKAGARQSAKAARANGSAPPLEFQSDSSSVARNVLPNGAPKGGDVSDMLEPRAPGPSAIRVTGQVEEAKKKNPAPQAGSAQESKKQRQNRKKAEEKRLQREADEQERQVLLEKQRRTAREARGEPAKNVMSTPAAPTESAWFGSAKSTSQANTTNGSTLIARDAPLLDTFDHDGLSTSSSNEPLTTSTTPATVASTYDPELPSEEVQLEMVNELTQNDEWNEVGTKGKKIKKKTATSASSASPPTVPLNGTEPPSYSTISNNDPADSTAKSIQTAKTVYSAKPVQSAKPYQNAAAPPKANTNGFAVLEAATTYTPVVKGHPDDSDWAVY